MSHHGPLARLLTLIGVGCAGFLAVAGGLALRGPGLVAVGVGGLLAGCTAAGIARESTAPRVRSTAESAVQATALTVGGLLVVAGVAVLGGGAVAALFVGAVLVVLLVRFGRRQPAAGTSPLRLFLAAPPPPPTEIRRLSLPPVAHLSTRELGEEWARTSVALAGRLPTAVYASLVQRRQETLDELERRDPDGFTRWLAVGCVADGDPADYVRGEPRLDGPAETDAA